MSPTRSKLIAFALAVLAALAVVGTAEAGWVTFKNDTNKALVVQEVVIINGKPVRGKPVRLGAGESLREFQNTPGIKNYEIYDASNPNAPPVWSNRLDCKADKQGFSITLQKNGRVGVDPVPNGK